MASLCGGIHDVQSPTGELHDPPGFTPEELAGTSDANNIVQPLLSFGALMAVEADGAEDVGLGRRGMRLCCSDVAVWS